MARTPEASFTQALRAAVERAWGVRPERIPLSYPPSPHLGDLASAVCFELARVLRRSPAEIAEAVAQAFEPGGEIARVQAAQGYVNGFFQRTVCLRRWLTETPRPESPAGDEKIVVEHTNINPNKAAHIGHLRNAVLGDTLVRCLRWLGRRVEVQNYIDDTGVQVADLVVGFRVLRGEDLETIRSRYDEATMRARGERFDYLAWDVYAEVTRFYEEDPSRLRHREAVLRAMEQGEGPDAALADYLAHRIVQYHLETMDRIGVRYELLARESDILRLRFWEHAFARLRAQGAARLAREGKNAGCWVMDLPNLEGTTEEEKVLVRSNGTVTYVAKDIAYQLWKFGLLDQDFRYRRFPWREREALYALWQTTSGEGAEEHPPFGRAGRVYNVIDARQSYLQQIVVQALRCLGHEEQAARSVHFAYEMVALTPAAVEALFPEMALDDAQRRKPYLEMSGRRGLGVRADDLTDALLERARREVRARNPELDAESVEATARAIGVAALRYYMLRFSRNRVVAFDLDAALAFEGETGPYLQYSVVRARNILRKLAQRRGAQEADPRHLGSRIELEAAGDEEEQSAHWKLPLGIARTEAVVRAAVESLELSMVAKHAYELAQAFNSFYHRFPVAQEEEEAPRLLRAAIVHLYQEGMTELLGLMGIPVPERM